MNKEAPPVNTRAQSGDPEDASLQVVMSERRQLIGVAYRLLGSLADAEDVVQETYTRWYHLSPDQREAIDNPGAWLTKVASRICLDVLGSARVRRERYVGEWVPEPVPGGAEWANGRWGNTSADPADRVTLDESISMAFLVVLESMSPAERVSFILHDVFRYSFAEVAEVVGRTPAACRQLASRARRHLAESHAPVSASTVPAEVVRGFKEAWAAQDIDALVALLAPDATTVADGGGVAAAVLAPVVGAEAIARRFAEIAAATRDQVVLEATVNGQPGLVAQENGVIVTVLAFDVVDDRITHIWAVRNPDKLRSWTAQ
jgi:RNA polymerase sigma-70 factor (ECF subfamily)